jgi:EmrB/QacA subfamily drug resistance transporter
MKSIDRKWWVLIAIGTGTFMSALDASVVNTVLPLIRDAFKSNVANIEWVVTIYLLLVSGLLLTFGRLGDLRGHKSVYVWGFAIFVLSSALCGLASSALLLVSFRAIQAFGAAMLSSNSPAILTGNFPDSQRGQALGLSATMTYLGLTAGPSLGGWLAQQFSWRAVFYINVPVGVLALGLSLYFIPRDIPDDQSKKFDLAGAVTFMTGLTALLLSLNKGHDWGWNSPLVLGLLLVAALMLRLFLRIERSSDSPMLDLSLFRSRTFSVTTASAVLNYICVYTILFLMPFYLIQGRSLSPATSGLLLTVQPIVMAIIAPVSGTLSDRIGTRIPTVLGMGLLGLGMFLLSRLGSHSPYTLAALGLGITGLGTGTYISPNNSALMGAAPRHRQGIASGILASARSVGMVLGVGLAGAILTTKLAGNPEAGLFSGTSLGFQITALIALLAGLISLFQKDLQKIKSPSI